MARSLANAKLFSAIVLDGFSNALTRSRGYAAAAAATQRATRVVSMSGKKMAPPKSGEDKGTSTSSKVSWVPDPVTGYYKPENIKEIDVADLRATLLNKKFNN